MGKVIDSSILIAAERGQLDLAAAVDLHREESFAIAAVTASELLHGVHRVRGRSKHARQEAFVETLLARMPVLPFDLVAARIHARIWAELAAKGQQVGERDLLIAATAIARGCDVVTRDLRSFPRIPGLKTVQW